jgi:hypothetical protein
VCKSLSEGGQRCAAHTKERLERKARGMREAAEQVATLGKEGMTVFHQARTEWEEAAVEYASTPTGAAALTERLTEAEATGDAQTAAMLTNIVQRGEALRAANEQIRAALTLGQFTEANLPDAELDEAIVADENNNPLSEADQKAWLALADVIQQKVNNLNDNARYRFRKMPEGLEKADATIAAADSQDSHLANAANTLTTCMYGDSGYKADPRPRDWDDMGGGYYDHEGEALKQQMREHQPVLRAQLRRLLQHPNAGASAFHAAIRHLPPKDLVQMPNCPASTIMGLPDATAENFDDATWDSLNRRTQDSLGVAVYVAKNHPDPRAREEAQARIIGTRWDTASTDEMSYLQRRLVGALPESSRHMVNESMQTYVRNFGDDNAKATLLPPEDETPAPVEPAPRVSLLRRTPRAERPTRDASIAS